MREYLYHRRWRWNNTLTVAFQTSKMDKPQGHQPVRDLRMHLRVVRVRAYLRAIMHVNRYRHFQNTPQYAPPPTGNKSIFFETPLWSRTSLILRIISANTCIVHLDLETNQRKDIFSYLFVTMIHSKSNGEGSTWNETEIKHNAFS